MEGGVTVVSAGSTRDRWLRLSVILLAFQAVMSAANPFFSHVTQRYLPSGGGLMPLGATLALIVLCAVNAIRSRRGGEPLTTPAETLGCYIVLIIGGWSAGWGLADPLIPLLTSPYVFGSPENGWLEHILPNLPGWAMGPADEPYASGFYMGLRTGTAIPWVAWVVPTLVWTAFGLALGLLGMGLAALLSRQWIEHDRLTFPHAEVLLGLCRGFVTDRRFWWAFAVAAAFPLWNNVIQALFPILPKINLTLAGGDVEWFKGAWKVTPFLNIGLIGILYFVHRDIVISIVIFFFVLAMEQYGIDIAGFKLENPDLINSNIMQWQNMGAIFGLVLFGLWAGRSTLARVVRAGWRGEDDGVGWISPRGGLVCLALGLAGVTLWLMLLGLRSPGPLLTFVLTQVVGMIGMVRVLMESSFSNGWPVGPSDFAVLVGGTAVIAPSGFVALALAQGWLPGGGWSNQFLAGMQADKLRSQFKFPRAVLITALLALVIGTIAVFYSTAWTCYERGANNFGSWSYKWHMRIPYDQATQSIRSEPVPPDPKRFGWLGVGIAVMGALIFLRNHVVGWFLHPVGFILAPMGIPAGAQGNNVVFAATLAWIVKTLILRLGGVEAYEKFKPLFAGLVVGHFLPDFISLVLDVIWFINTGHKLE